MLLFTHTSKSIDFSIHIIHCNLCCVCAADALFFSEQSTCGPVTALRDLLWHRIIACIYKISILVLLMILLCFYASSQHTDIIQDSSVIESHLSCVQNAHTSLVAESNGWKLSSQQCIQI